MSNPGYIGLCLSYRGIRQLTEFDLEGPDCALIITWNFRDTLIVAI